MHIESYEKKAEIIITELPLDNIQKELLRQNWLFFLTHLEKRIKKNYVFNKWLSIIGIIGGITIPAISSFPLLENANKIIVSVLGIITASSIAINQNQKHNEKWRHFRKMVELARIEGENFLSLATDDYFGKTHKECFSIFMAKLAFLKNLEINTYFDNIDGLVKKTKD